MEQNVKKALCIINKHAGIGSRIDLEQLFSRECETHEVAGTIEFTTHAGHGIELAQEAPRKGYDLVVAVGGDGTLNEVAQGLLHTGIPMGIVPRGSGNGLARHFKIPLDVPHAMKQLFVGKVISMDTFTVNEKLSLNVSGIGFDGHITNMFGVRSGRGFFGYAYLTVMEFLRFKEFEVVIAANDQTFVRNAFIVAIANSSQYGNNARIAPAASVCDGLLHLNVVKKVPPYRIDFLISFFNGNLDRSSYCEIMRTSSLQLRVKQPTAYHIDGEPCGKADTFKIQLIPSALKVVVPQTQTRY